MTAGDRVSRETNLKTSDLRRDIRQQVEEALLRQPGRPSELIPAGGGQ
jgi:hypothetical protein